MAKIKMFFLFILFFLYLFCTPFDNSIRIISPNGSERYYANSTIKIDWIPLNPSIAYVKIELYKNGKLDTVIAENTGNTGTCNWSIPENQNPDETYKILIRDISKPSDNDQSDSSFTISKSKRVPAEWEEIEAVLGSWESSLEESQTMVIKTVIKEISSVAKVYVIVNDTVEESPLSGQSGELATFGVNIDNVFFYYYSPRTIWIRNYAPIFFFLNGNLTMLDFDYYDTNNFPIDLASQLGKTLINANELDLSGGNFISDGRNTSITTLGIHTYHPIYGINGYFNQNYETDGEIFAKLSEFTSNKHSVHTNFIEGEFNIDFIAKMVSPTTFLVGQYADSIGNEDAPDNIIANQLTTAGYTVVRIPQPLYQYEPSTGSIIKNSKKSNYLKGKEITTVYGTYTNSLIVNGKILMPSYGIDEDTNAENIYKSVLSDYTIVKIDCQSIMPLGGAIHSITKEIPKFDTVVSFSY